MSDLRQTAQQYIPTAPIHYSQFFNSTPYQDTTALQHRVIIIEVIFTILKVHEEVICVKSQWVCDKGKEITWELLRTSAGDN